MCGIAGIVCKSGNVIRDRLQAMTDALKHRGPDAGECLVEGKFGFGHRRLSIIDLSEGANQPFVDVTGRYVIVFNGEIYNFKQVKSLLGDYPFRTSGDTEVLLAAFARWGIGAIDHLEGMFAFAVFDRMSEKLTLVRDRFGVKPLYYFYNGNLLVFSSEIRSLLASGYVSKELDQHGLFEYFSFQSVGSPLSVVKGIKQLHAGHYLEYSSGGMEIRKYWYPYPHTVIDEMDSGKIREKIRDLFFRSVEKRLIADVPIGAFLSGGIDSSAVVAVMAQVSSRSVNTFNVYFDDEEYDESEFAELIARKYNTNHTAIHMHPEDFLHQLPSALAAIDSPSADGINTFVVSQAIRQAGIKVALSGLGGDELFAGYPVFRQYSYITRFKGIWGVSTPLRSIIKALIGSGSSRKERIREILSMRNPSIGEFYPISREIFAKGQIREYTCLDVDETALEVSLRSEEEELDKLPILSQVSVAEYLGYTQQTLLKDTDQMSMAHSLEVREPYFDHDLVQYVLGVADKHKTGSYPKALLVDALSPLLPLEVVARKKKGFSFPWEKWMRNELKDFCESRINSIMERGFMRQDKLASQWQRFLGGDGSVRWSEIWLFVVLEEWLRNNDFK